MKQKTKVKQKQVKKKKKYLARSGARFTEKEAQVIGEEFDRLQFEKGYLTSREVLDSARSRDSVLHKYFEWDDSEAAEKWRHQQARMLINHVVEIVIINDKPVEQRSFLSVTNDKHEISYVTVDVAIENQSYRKQLLDKMILIQENLLVTLKMFRDN